MSEIRVVFAREKDAREDDRSAIAPYPFPASTLRVREFQTFRKVIVYFRDWEQSFFFGHSISPIEIESDLFCGE